MTGHLGGGWSSLLSAISALFFDQRYKAVRVAITEMGRLATGSDIRAVSSHGRQICQIPRNSPLTEGLLTRHEA
jgi:hypothetical protein